LLVKDSLKALQAISHHIRMKRPAMPVVGVTGSNGKTTTKELAALVLGRRFAVLKSSGNFNNQIGLPLNLCRLEAGHGAAVLEMGASRPGDIGELCAVASPTHGIITNVSESHLEGFTAKNDAGENGDDPMRALMDTKLELARAAEAVVYNADDARLRGAVLGEFGGKSKTLISFGTGSGADLRAEDIVMERGCPVFRMSGRGQRAMARLSAAGLFNIHNALAAAACGLLFDISLPEAADAMAGFTGVPMRYGIRELAGALILSDVYNANPASMDAAIDELVRLRGKRAVAVLGDMLELGRYAGEAHRRLGARMALLPVDVFIAVGPMMAMACAEFSSERNGKGGGLALSCADSALAGKALMENLRAGDTVLVKGSRGVRMERVLESMTGFGPGKRRGGGDN
nr:UDP-N-acetylmuramoyl-tripeptide--D-alanyl-D-alanine ligase [Nitrospiraceae bacterium]